MFVGYTLNSCFSLLIPLDLEYVQVKPILTAATLILKATGTYKEGELSWSAGYLYVSFVYNISICLRYVSPPILIHSIRCVAGGELPQARYWV